MRTNNTDSLFCLALRTLQSQVVAVFFFRSSFFSLHGYRFALSTFAVVLFLVENFKNRLFIVHFNYSAKEIERSMKADEWIPKIALGVWSTKKRNLLIKRESGRCSILLKCQLQFNSNIIAVILYFTVQRATNFWHGKSIGHRSRNDDFPNAVGPWLLPNERVNCS